MPEVVDKVQKNLKDRVSAITAVPETAKNTLMEAKEEFMDMRPAKAATTVLKRVGDGVLTMIDEQLDITRRWI